MGWSVGCPFCGGFKLSLNQPYDESEIYTVECLTCNAQGPHYDISDSTSPTEAKTLWDKRVTAP